MSHRLVSALGVMLFTVLALPLAAAPPAAQSCEKIASLKLQNTTITSAVAVRQSRNGPACSLSFQIAL